MSVLCVCDNVMWVWEKRHPQNPNPLYAHGCYGSPSHHFDTQTFIVRYIYSQKKHNHETMNCAHIDY